MRASALGLSSSNFHETPTTRRQDIKDKFDLQDYAVIEKVSQLVHAVGRVSERQGSAVLISLPDPVAFTDYQTRTEAAQRRRSSGRSRRFPFRRDRFGNDGAMFSRDGATPRSPYPRGTDAASRAGARDSGNGVDEAIAEKTPAHFALLLTTSRVFATREQAAAHTVTFLEQPVAGTAAQLGRQPRPITVAVRSDCGFICSVPDNAHHHPTPQQTREPDDADTTAQTTLQDAKRRPSTTRSSLSGSTTLASSSSPTAAAVGGGVDEESEEAVSIGYSMTYCEVLPVPSPATADSQRPGDSMTEGGASFTVGHSLTFMGSSFATAEQQSAAAPPLGWTHLRAPPRGAAAPPVRRGLYLSGAAADMQSSCASLGQYRKPATEDLFLIKPLHMPLLAASMAPVRSGDVHLWVTHLLDGVRHYTLRRVADVFDDCCLYEESNEDAVECSSGGVVFDANGDFVGLQHQEDGEALCILTTSVVRHLFTTNKLALCRSPIVTGAPAGFDAGAEPLSEDRDSSAEPTTGGGGGGSSSTPGLDRPGTGTQSLSSASLRAGPGLVVEDFQQLLDARLRRERQMPVTQRVPTTDEVFKAFYTDFASLSRMLHAFSYSPQLTEKILSELSRHEHRSHWSALASSGAIGLTLEIIDGNADNETLVMTALSTLAQLSIFDANLTVFIHVDGVPTVMEIMKEYIHNANLLQWGAYCLVQATAATAPFVSDTVAVFVRSAGVELAVECLRQHGSRHRHLTLWVSTLLANTLQRAPQYITVVVHEDLPPMLIQHMSDYSDDFPTLEGLLRLVHTIVTPLAGSEWSGAVSSSSHTHRKTTPSAHQVAVLMAAPAAPHGDVSSLGSPDDLAREVSSLPEGSSSPPLSEVQRLSSSEVSGGRSTVTPAVVERNAFFVRRAFARQERLVWNVLSHVCDAASRVNYSTRSVGLMQLAVDTLLVLVQWGLLPLRRVRNILTAALARTETNYPTATTLLTSFRRCHEAVEAAVAAEMQDANPRKLSDDETETAPVAAE